MMIDVVVPASDEASSNQEKEPNTRFPFLVKDEGEAPWLY